MKDSEWEDAAIAGGPEELLDTLIKSGYPWNALGTRLKVIDQQFETVTNEYAEIKDSMDRIRSDVTEINRQQGGLSAMIKAAVEGQATHLQNRWLVGVGAMLAAFAGLGMAIFTNDKLSKFMSEHSWIGLVVFIVSVLVIALVAIGSKRTG